MSINRRTLLAAPLAAPLALPTGSSRAADFPDRPIRVVVPYAPGTNSDVQTRLVTARMGELLGQSFVIENRAGAGGSLGAEVVAKARPDGYTLLCGSNGPLAINPALQPRLGYAPADFAPIGMMNRTAHTISVRADAPWPDLAAYVAAARAAPGSISIGSSGNGSATHFTLEVLMAGTGARLTHIPYRGSSLAVADLVGGNVASVCSEISTVLPTLRGGQTRVLGLAAPIRSVLAPEVPTCAEAGVPLEGASWVGLVAPAGVPAPMLAALSQALLAALDDPRVAERSRATGADPAPAEYRTPEGFAGFIAAELTRVRDVGQRTGMRLE